MALANRSLVFRIAIAGSVAAALSLSACGKKGPLEDPPKANATGTLSKDDSRTEPSAATETVTKDKGKAKPNRPFFLDPLI